MKYKTLDPQSEFSDLQISIPQGAGFRKCDTRKRDLPPQQRQIRYALDYESAASPQEICLPTITVLRGEECLLCPSIAKVLEAKTHRCFGGSEDWVIGKGDIFASGWRV